MTDNELIELIAEIWVKNGGDKLGFELCYRKIVEKIKEKEKEENET